jgi:hypothetical protein
VISKFVTACRNLSGNVWVALDVLAAHEKRRSNIRALEHIEQVQRSFARAIIER